MRLGSFRQESLVRGLPETPGNRRESWCSCAAWETASEKPLNGWSFVTTRKDRGDSEEEELLS